MKNSCNGCRVLRKGCTEDCPLRPSLAWIDSPQGQANATIFLAKFYGRAGLINLLNAGPPDLRPDIYKSLLEEACGRIINPINGAVGLTVSQSWDLCEEATARVLNGIPITQQQQAPPEPGQTINVPFTGSDIRHITKNGDPTIKTRKRFRRNGEGSSTSQLQLHGNDQMDVEPAEKVAMELLMMNDLIRTPSNESIGSVETVEGGFLVKNEDDQPGRVENTEDPNNEMDLNLSLGLCYNLSALADAATKRDD